MTGKVQIKYYREHSNDNVSVYLCDLIPVLAGVTLQAAAMTSIRQLEPAALCSLIAISLLSCVMIIAAKLSKEAVFFSQPRQS